MNKSLILIILLISMAQAGYSLYIPSLPAIALHMHTLPSLVQLTLVFNLIGSGLSQLFYGPVSDFCGRKNTVLSGIYIFLFGSIVCFTSINIDMLLIGRFLQGIGIGAATTISRAILTDIFHGKEYIIASSKLASIVTIIPMCAPIFGGYIQDNYGWRANFCVLAFIAILMVICWNCLFAETIENQNKKNIIIFNIFKNYNMILKNSYFFRNVISGGLFLFGEMIFISIAPFLLQNQLAISSSLYGWILFCTIGGFMCGASVSSYLSNKLNLDKLIFFGHTLSSFASIAMLICGIINHFNLVSVVLPMILFMLGAGFIFPNTTAEAMRLFPEKAGTASAVLSSLQGLLAAMGGIVVSVIFKNSLKDMGIILFLICIFSWYIYTPIFIQKYERELKDN